MSHQQEGAKIIAHFADRSEARTRTSYRSFHPEETVPRRRRVPEELACEAGLVPRWCLKKKKKKKNLET